MILRFWILIFLSPFITYALYLILDEGRDPLIGFHDEFRSERFGLENVEGRSGWITSGKLKGLRERDLSIALASAVVVVLVALGIPVFIVGALGVSGVTYFLFKRDESSRSQKKALRLQEAEFPAVVELLAILIAAGESPSTALVHISNRAEGYMGQSLKMIANALRQGEGLISSLERAAKASRSDSFKRFCDALIVAVERGTPLVGVLQSQVIEARNSESHRMIKNSGRAEIVLMVPIVFLILPISILFALWPSYVTLGASIHG